MTAPRVPRSKLHDAVAKKKQAVSKPDLVLPKPEPKHVKDRKQRTAKARDKKMATMPVPPVGTKISIHLDPDGKWYGTMLVPDAGPAFGGQATGRFKLVEMLNDFWLATLPASEKTKST
jgi:hypothetical protein